ERVFEARIRHHDRGQISAGREAGMSEGKGGAAGESEGGPAGEGFVRHSGAGIQRTLFRQFERVADRGRRSFRRRKEKGGSGGRRTFSGGHDGLRRGRAVLISRASSFVFGLWR